jgi:hypothetical protein
MSLLPKVAWISILASAAFSPAPPQAAAQTAQVQRVSLSKSASGTQIEIQTSRRVIPLTQILTDPDRLVIDFSDAIASPQIHTINVNNAVVKQVRVGRVTDNPPITRVVIDLTSAQPFQLLPSGKSVIVKIGDGGNAAAPAVEVAKDVPAAKPEPPAPAAVAADQPSAGQPAPSVVPVPTLSPARKSVSSPVATAVPVASRSVPPTPIRAAVLNTAPESAPPAVSITRVPITPAGRGEVRRVAVLKTSGATEIEIETSQRMTPEVQTVTGPDRLVIDFPQASPGPLLRALAVNQGEVKGVRVGLLSAKPPVTRVVLDLKSPQAYQLFPSTRSVIVKLGDSANSGAAMTPSPAAPTAGPATPAPATEPSAAPPPPKKVDVAFQGGKLSLTSDKASLAEVLNELRDQTGADIVIPAGAEREEVAVSLGPASPREVISQLLNGSRYNFIMLGADDDANRVTKLILTPKTAGGVIPQGGDDALPPMPEPVPVAQVQGVSGPAPAVPPAIDEVQPQGDSNPPPDTAPQPGDPQAAPN